ncbi:hypothetical protein FUT84_10405 [Treponema phagedenis]|uniref:Uncharacterized protein n=1 Tax=Treponema phagedenis TaxID=162 RepID=A0AAE6IWP4_TREPH|nr:hypothetical protein FUT79_10915 [Treponema phagedenis]QEJ98592.1 hypothetical protein FUT82_11685 [Treponema phagedenis]QEK01525.1 hypothetical protein FUT84_10405 [Treponema phagedenis]QEK04097.1 hypothetical protein FUT83_09980 [Treponema phagedenis]QEK06545.1 hypothetical protein FUT80_07335 [Treponema phagedenis]
MLFKSKTFILTALKILHSLCKQVQTPVVPRRSDVLKQDYLQSFKTRRHNFATDGKTQNGHGCPWFQAAAMF